MRSSPWSSAQTVTLLILVVLITYANVYGNAWLFDDEFLVLKNHFLDSFADLGRIFTSSSTAGAGFHDSFYRPTQGLVYLIVNQIFGRSTAAFHALNVAAHALNALLVWSLGRRLGLTPAAALIGALLWAVHPLHVEAITYVSATADPLHAGFALLALNLIARPEARRSSRRIFAATLATGAALLSKESAIVTPALVVVVIFLTDPRRFAWRPYLVSLPFWLTAGVYLGARRFILGAAGSMEFPRPNAYADHPLVRLWTALAALQSYVELLAWPHDLHMDRDFPPYDSPWSAPVLLGALMVALALAAIVTAWRRRTPGWITAAGFCAWVLAAHAPHSGVLLAVNSVFLEHWMYLTAIPVFLSVGIGLARVRPAWARVGLAALLVIALAQKTWRQNEVWATPVRFFGHTLGYSPESARIRHNLALAYLDDGRVDEGLEQLELMIRADTPYPATYHTAAHVYLTRRQFERAEPYYLKALALDPNFYPSVQDLALLYEFKGDAARAVEYQRRFRTLRP